MKGLYVAVAIALWTAGAQGATGRPPAIVSFYTDAYAVNFNLLEAGQAQGTFTWRAVGLTSGYRLALEVYVANQWLAVQEAGTILPASGSVTTTLRHPLNFGMPTYRLSILDSGGNILDQQMITIPYTLTQATPFVQSFSTSTFSVDPRALIEGRARVRVSWQVSNRPPGSNVIFEQLFDDGSTASVELPRANLWVSSSGSGEVAPTAPPVGVFVKLRLRVVDMSSGNVYVESELAVPIIEATPTPSATRTPTPTRTPTATVTPRVSATP